MYMENPTINQENKYLFVERKSPEILSLLLKAPIYKKYGTVNIRPAVPGESISTVLSDGTIETADNIAGDDDYVVTNPGGEKYIISKEKLESRYSKSDTEGVYKAKGYIRAIKNPYGKDIETLASWGKNQTGDVECYIADVCDESGYDMGGEPYIIEHNAFSDTYKPILVDTTKSF